MKKIRKIIICFFFVASISALFGMDYPSLIEKARAFENENQWAYALGYYFDAVTLAISDANNSDTEAIERFRIISNAIREGKPGLGTYDIFSLHDQWKNLIENTEKYFSEFPPYDINVGKLTESGLDYNTKTASYTTKITFSESRKYQEILKLTILVGFYRARKDDWTDLSRSWPSLSVIEKPKTEAEYTNILKNKGIALCIDQGNFLNTQGTTINRKSVSNYVIPSWNFYFITGEGYTPYSIELGLFDETGNLLLKGESYLIPTIFTSSYDERKPYIFQSVPVSIMQLISEKKVTIKPIAFHSNYGEFNYDLAPKNWFNEGMLFYRNIIIEKLPKFQIPIDNLNIVYESNLSDDERKKQGFYCVGDIYTDEEGNPIGIVYKVDNKNNGWIFALNDYSSINSDEIAYITASKALVEIENYNQKNTSRIWYIPTESDLELIDMAWSSENSKLGNKESGRTWSWHPESILDAIWDITQRKYSSWENIPKESTDKIRLISPF